MLCSKRFSSSVLGPKERALWYMCSRVPQRRKRSVVTRYRCYENGIVRVDLRLSQHLIKKNGGIGCTAPGNPSVSQELEPIWASDQSRPLERKSHPHPPQLFEIPGFTCTAEKGQKIPSGRWRRGSSKGLSAMKASQ